MNEENEVVNRMKELILVLQEADKQTRWFYANGKGYLLPGANLDQYILKVIDNLASHLGNVQVKELGIDRYANDVSLEHA